jgi:hypothetical protein
MILIRREIALVAAILVASYVGSLIWIAVVLVAWSLIAMDRWPALLAARGGVDSGTPIDPTLART